MVTRDFPISLLDLLYHVNNLTQDSVESGGRGERVWRIGQRSGPFTSKDEIQMIGA